MSSNNHKDGFVLMETYVRDNASHSTPILITHDKREAQAKLKLMKEAFQHRKRFSPCCSDGVVLHDNEDCYYEWNIDAKLVAGKYTYCLSIEKLYTPKS